MSYPWMKGLVRKLPYLHSSIIDTCCCSCPSSVRGSFESNTVDSSSFAALAFVVAFELTKIAWHCC